MSRPPEPVEARDLTAEEFWATHCSDCAHDLHPMDVCSAIVGGGHPGNGPDYCPCAIDYPGLAAAYQAALRADTAQVSERLRTLVAEWRHAASLTKDEAVRLVVEGMADEVSEVALRADTARVPEGLVEAAEQWELQPGDKHEVETRYRREGWWLSNQRGDSLFFEPRDAVTFLDYLAALATSPEGGFR